jgi:acyl-CoA synthetase (NDP forming)
MPHALDALLNPGSIAVLGATRRPGAVGNTIVRNLLKGGFAGRLFAVNPRYADVEGVRCFATLAELPEPVEQVIFAVGDDRIEAALEDAIRAGVRTCVIYSSLVLAGDTEPPLRERVLKRLREAGVIACGANGMGYYNFRARVWACGFETRAHRDDGNITLISQSGAGMSGILDVDERLNFNLAVSTGQELSVSVEDYMDWALEQPETKVIGLFLETSRRPDSLIAALEKARRKRIPVVAVKVGRAALSAELAVSHCGALAGNDAAYAALFDRHGVQRVEDMDELATALIMFAQPHPVAPGGVVAIHDSGGERQLLIDLAERMHVPLTRLAPETVRDLEQLLDPGLPAVNPLDAWSAGGMEYHLSMEACFAKLLEDPGAAFGAVVHDRSAGGAIFPAYAGYLRAGHAAAGKPVFLVTNRQGTGADPLVIELTREGFPVLDGVRSFLSGARCLLEYCDFLSRPAQEAPAANEVATARWRARLAEGTPINEAEAMSLLTECGIPGVAALHVGNEGELKSLTAGLRYPVVLKTANPAIAHKSDAGGVVRDIASQAQLLKAYAAMSRGLGSAATLAPMVREDGVEMILGMTSDDQFGPIVLLGIGGVQAELLGDVVTALPPFDAGTAERLIGRLRMRRLLDRVRGRPAVDVPAFCRAAAAFSAMVPAIADLVREIDINPVKVFEKGCLALDALIVPARPAPAEDRSRKRRSA